MAHVKTKFGLKLSKNCFRHLLITNPCSDSPEPTSKFFNQTSSDALKKTFDPSKSAVESSQDSGEEDEVGKIMRWQQGELAFGCFSGNGMIFGVKGQLIECDQESEKDLTVLKPSHRKGLCHEEFGSQKNF
ncbi:putative cyclic nucleotide-gated ion channel 20, chloroplastic-like protein [Corchorus olitorius]|uniref:Cyclic nucleotide-gated ion channel 20, chloroplastic-like protein n=1 Tax=Corchorus olitorius TaxID=93759 RepID=A0A1R3G1Z1_9ROSI|nr:putative cyclic nucleotide-gated ion channel 20, chloroplastic-like protein [Corchorus olitorius]